MLRAQGHEPQTPSKTPQNSKVSTGVAAVLRTARARAPSGDGHVKHWTCRELSSAWDSELNETEALQDPSDQKDAVETCTWSNGGSGPPPEARKPQL